MRRDPEATTPPEPPRTSKGAPAEAGAARRGRGRPAGGRRVVDRNLLLDAAERVIAREGNGASLEAIAVEAGVTKPIVYARIGSRADLSNALAGRLTERLIAQAQTQVGASRLDRDSLAGFFRVTLQTIATHRELFMYVTRGSADDTAERALYLASQSAHPLAGLLARWREHNGLDVSATEPWAYAIIGMLNMVSLWWLEQGTQPVQQLADQLADLVWSGMGAS